MSLNVQELLKKLPRIKADDDIWMVVTATRMQAMQDLFVAICQGRHMKKGGGIRFSNGPDWVMIRSDSDTTSSIGGGEIEPLQVIPDDLLDGTTGLVLQSRARVVYGTVGRHVGDDSMTPYADGTLTFPYFYINTLDQHTIYIHQTRSFDGNFWQIDQSEILSASTVPTDTVDGTAAYFSLAATRVDPTTFRTSVSTVFNVGNFEVFIAGNDTAAQSKYLKVS